MMEGEAAATLGKPTADLLALRSGAVATCEGSVGQALGGIAGLPTGASSRSSYRMVSTFTFSGAP